MRPAEGGPHALAAWRRAAVLALAFGLGAIVSIVGVTLINGAFARDARELRARIMAIDAYAIRRGMRYVATIASEDGTTARISLEVRGAR